MQLGPCHAGREEVQDRGSCSLQCLSSCSPCSLLAAHALHYGVLCSPVTPLLLLPTPARNLPSSWTPPCLHHPAPVLPHSHPRSCMSKHHCNSHPHPLCPSSSLSSSCPPPQPPPQPGERQGGVQRVYCGPPPRPHERHALAHPDRVCKVPGTGGEVQGGGDAQGLVHHTHPCERGL